MNKLTIFPTLLLALVIFAIPLSGCGAEAAEVSGQTEEAPEGRDNIAFADHICESVEWVSNECQKYISIQIAIQSEDMSFKDYPNLME